MTTTPEPGAALEREPLLREGYPPAKHLEFQPQYDGLRGIGLLLICGAHFHPLPVPHTVGVAMLMYFFVLSGYLITRILLVCKDSAEETGFWPVLRNFYARRFVRILPLYYTIVIGGAALGVLTGLAWFDPLVQTFWWNMAYAMNFYIIAHDTLPGSATHLWSLAIEEQFYLVWPWFILLIPRRFLPAVFVGLMVFGFGFRVYGYNAGWSYHMLNMHTFGNLETIVSGALIAYLTAYRDRSVLLIRYTIGAGIVGVAALGSFLYAEHVLGDHVLGAVFRNLGLAGISTVIVVVLMRTLPGGLGALLRWKHLVYVGGIGYGAYVFHNFMQWPVNNLWLFVFDQRPHELGAGHPVVWIAFTLMFVATVLVSMVSWHFFEAPINSLKRFFPYSNKRAPEWKRVVPELFGAFREAFLSPFRRVRGLRAGGHASG